MEHKIYQTKAPLNEVKTSDDRTFNIQMFLYHHLWLKCIIQSIWQWNLRLI